MTGPTSDGSNGVPNGGVSYWYTSTELPTYRESLPGNREADVCIVGAGLTGLWAAYYLKRSQPDLRIVILEREFAGFGASGRNGGWLSAELAGSRELYAKTHGHQGVVDLLAAMRSAVDEVIGVAKAEGIDADIVKDGLLHVARNRAQVERVRETIEYEKFWGATVEAIEPQLARTDRGVVRAPIVLRCLEGFTAGIKGQRRGWLPMNSSMIVTAPLPDSVLAEIGWTGAEVLGDAAHAYMYAQRTADNRIALGGRGIPYRYGSRTDVNGETQDATIDALTALLHDMFPAAVHVPIAQAWCGVLGVPRDWCATVDLDQSTGLGTAGGYVGSGLTTTNLAGRTLADLVLRRDTGRTRLPWVGRRVRRWEPEPLRWLGVQAMYTLYRVADRRENELALPRTSSIARFANKVAGR